jgi:hypothetical protein
MDDGPSSDSMIPLDADFLARASSSTRASQPRNDAMLNLPLSRTAATASFACERARAIDLLRRFADRVAPSRPLRRR